MRRIPHQEHYISHPEFYKYLTGIDLFDKPRTASLRAVELLKPLDAINGRIVYMYPDDTPLKRYEMSTETVIDEDGHKKVVWGEWLTGHWDWGQDFQTIEQALEYSPLEHLSELGKYCFLNVDFSLDDESFYQHCAERQEKGEWVLGGFYNTMFMWPILTFGWEKFLEMAAGYQDELKRILDEFAVVNRKLYRANARYPGEFDFGTHDDICMTAGPVCSPDWLRKFIYPYYEEFFDILHKGGKKVIFTSDGNIDQVADDLIACGVDGLISEPYTDWRTIARKHPQLKMLAGEGDNRTLTYGSREDIVRMVEKMVETAQYCQGYHMCIGNQIPWNIPPENLLLYFDTSKEIAFFK